MEKRVRLRAAAVRNPAAAKENCGRKSLLIEHEVCHLKLESCQPPPKPQQAGISVAPILKCRRGPGCVSPSHRGPFALAGAPPPSVCVPGRTVGHLAALDALLMPPRSGVWDQVTAASPGREKKCRRLGGGATNPRIHAKYLRPKRQVKESTRRRGTKAQCGWI